MFITILENFLPTLLLGPTRLLKSEKVFHLHGYYDLHSYYYLKKFPTYTVIGAPRLLATSEK